MRRVSAKFAPKVLTPDRKDVRLSVPQDLLQCARNDENFIKSIVAGMDTTQKLRSSLQCGRRLILQDRRRQNRADAVETVLTVFIDYKGIIRHEFSPPDQIVNQDYCFSVLFCFEPVEERDPTRKINSFNTILIYNESIESKSCLYNIETGSPS